MHRAKESLPARIDTPQAVARHLGGFGEANGAEMSAEFFTMKKGTDITPLLEGLPEDMCQCPHWGYVLEGDLTVRYTDGTEEPAKGGEVFYWPPGHTVRVNEDAKVILFSPARHAHVIDHMADKLS